MDIRLLGNQNYFSKCQKIKLSHHKLNQVKYIVFFWPSVQIAHSHIENVYISFYNMPLDASFIPSHVDTNEMGYTKVILKFNNENNQL